MSDEDPTALYDRIGAHYATTRGSEPRIARLSVALLRAERPRPG